VVNEVKEVRMDWAYSTDGIDKKFLNFVGTLTKAPVEG
jgi:hypothetical protein